MLLSKTQLNYFACFIVLGLFLTMSFEGTILYRAYQNQHNAMAIEMLTQLDGQQFMHVQDKQPLWYQRFSRQVSFYTSPDPQKSTEISLIHPSYRLCSALANMPDLQFVDQNENQKNTTSTQTSATSYTLRLERCMKGYPIASL